MLQWGVPGPRPISGEVVPAVRVGRPRGASILWRSQTYRVAVEYHKETPFARERYPVPAFTIYADRSNERCVSIGSREALQADAAGISKNIYFDLFPGRLASLYTDDPEFELIDLSQFFASNCSYAGEIFYLHITIFNAVFV